MNVEVTKLPESRISLKVELTGEEVDQALDRTYRQLVQRISVPGFRKGKAPRAVVERVVGHELFLHEATDEAVRWAYRKAVDQEHLVPIDEAEIQPGEDSHEHVRPGEPFQFDATVTVRPAVQLPDYHAIHLERPEIEVSDGDVDALLQEIRQRNATLEPVARPAQVGDVVTMNAVARVEGQEVVNEENADFELRDEDKDDEETDALFPGLSKELVGANRGDIREVTLPLPDLYQNQEMAGKTMFLRILLKEIKRKVLPELDDELAQSISEFSTLDEVRAALRANLEEERKLEADEKLVADAVEALTSRTFIEIPPALVEEELDRLIDDMERAFERRHMNFEMWLQTTGQSEDDLRAAMREGATSNVKTSLVLASLADAEDIQATNREVDASLENLLRGTAENERRRLRASPAVRANIRSRIRRQRALQKLVEIVTGGGEVSPEATEAVADQTAAAAEDTQETVAVEIGG